MPPINIQWFQNGDHPLDSTMLVDMLPGGGFDVSGEGKVVRYYRHPSVAGRKLCEACNCPFEKHGFIDSSGCGQVVCPGSWILEFQGCDPRFFATFDPLEIYAYQGLRIF